MNFYCTFFNIFKPLSHYFFSSSIFIKFPSFLVSLKLFLLSYNFNVRNNLFQRYFFLHIYRPQEHFSQSPQHSDHLIMSSSTKPFACVCREKNLVNVSSERSKMVKWQRKNSKQNRRNFFFSKTKKRIFLSILSRIFRSLSLDVNFHLLRRQKKVGIFTHQKKISYYINNFCFNFALISICHSRNQFFATNWFFDPFVGSLSVVTHSHAREPIKSHKIISHQLKNYIFLLPSAPRELLYMYHTQLSSPNEARKANEEKLWNECEGNFFFEIFSAAQWRQKMFCGALNGSTASVFLKFDSVLDFFLKKILSFLTLSKMLSQKIYSLCLFLKKNLHTFIDVEIL